MGARSLTAVLACLFLARAHPSAGQEAVGAYAVDSERSSLFVVTHRSGLLSFLGHEHAIIPTDWTADLCLNRSIPKSSRGRVTIRTASLVVDSDSARALAGLGGGPSVAQTVTIQSKLLDSSHLDVTSYPVIVITADSAIWQADGSLLAFGRVELHGVTREVTLPIQVDTLAADSARLSGILRIRQRDFGIEPESMRGVVKVSNEVDLHFDLVARPGPQACGVGSGQRERELDDLIGGPGGDA